MKPDKEFIKKLSIYVNAALMTFVACMVGAFAYFGVEYMIYHSIPTLFLYVVYFFLIKSGKLDLYLWMVYATILAYMTAATICLGYDCGFHLYCMSMIPIIFYTEYLAYKLNSRRPLALQISLMIVTIYAIGTSIAVINGPVYDVGKVAVEIFQVVNSLSVFAFLISYTAIIVKFVMTSTQKMEYMAHFDQLTDMYNRHYMMENIKGKLANGEGAWIAIVDIDKFKRVNDTYGHMAGDIVLKTVGRLMKEKCLDCLTARWGGEEFLIMPAESYVSTDVLEVLRKSIEDELIPFEDETLRITISIGSSIYKDEYTVAKWIQKADECLYKSKDNGRNRITIG